MRGAVRSISPVDLGRRDVAGVCVDMEVDEPGHEGPTSHIDAPCAGGDDGTVGDLRDAITGHQHREPLAHYVDAIEHTGILQEDLAHSTSFRC